MLWWMTAALAVAPGDYDVAHAPAEVQARKDAGVEATLAAFPAIFRGLARGKVTESTTHCAHYAFRFPDGGVAWSCDGKPELVVTPADNGQTRPLTLPDGRTFDATITWASPVLTAVFGSDSGARTNVWTFQGDGSIRMVSTVSSPRLEVPLTWTLDYKRR